MERKRSMVSCLMIWRQKGGGIRGDKRGGRGWGFEGGGDAVGGAPFQLEQLRWIARAPTVTRFRPRCHGRGRWPGAERFCFWVTESCEFGRRESEGRPLRRVTKGLRVLLCFLCFLCFLGVLCVPFCLLLPSGIHRHGVGRWGRCGCLGGLAGFFHLLSCVFFLFCTRRFRRAWSLGPWLRISARDPSHAKALWSLSSSGCVVQ